MLVWISDLGMKKGFPEITGNPICGAKGTPVVCWYSAVSSAFRNCGYLVGYLTWFFLASFQRCRTYTKGRILSIYLSIYQENVRRPQERRTLSVANNR